NYLDTYRISGSSISVITTDGLWRNFLRNRSLSKDLWGKGDFPWVSFIISLSRYENLQLIV
ncbi:hypothetical protein, partial [Pectobacterium versatile]|uniref:hypothetical protein n=1 Tax=Pectobacterium versatile TaxID=2488639 RepID=UPI001F1A79B3